MVASRMSGVWPMAEKTVLSVTPAAACVMWSRGALRVSTLTWSSFLTPLTSCPARAWLRRTSCPNTRADRRRRRP